MPTSHHIAPIAHQVEVQLRLQLHRHPQLIAGIVGGAAVLGTAAYLYVRSRRPTPEELERRRRDFVARIGRLTDGQIIDARSHDGADSISPTPDVLFYSYRHAGVTYNCAQDVSPLPALVLGYRIDQPIQVRYDVHNPGNSIIVAESWSGLRLNPNSIHLPPSPYPSDAQSTFDFPSTPRNS